MISSILLCIPSPLVAVFQVEHFTVKAFVLLMASVWVSPLILANCTLVGSLNPAVSWNASWNVPIEQSALTKLLTNCMCCEAFQKARYFSTLSSKKQPLLLHFLTKCFVFPSITFPFPLNTFCVLSQYFFFSFLVIMDQRHQYHWPLPRFSAASVVVTQPPPEPHGKSPQKSGPTSY